jgi:hypothetical protein
MEGSSVTFTSAYMLRNMRLAYTTGWFAHDL